MGKRLLHCRLLALAPLLLAWLAPWPAAGAASSFDDASLCLALALYFEARTEGREGMLAVASVVLGVKNRTELADAVAAEAAGPLSETEWQAISALC